MSMSIRLVELIERRLRDITRKEGGKGVILRHLKMAYRIGFDSTVKTESRPEQARSFKAAMKADKRSGNLPATALSG